ncbi:glycerate kinase [Nocardioides luteus]|uniref:Glycerate kinase n=1 Tax=Nocardioides luteus TaxID=1844 RepID=A0ABQ5T6L6_9ACTN|nr:glycerate kinase [Nocardioides luteus]MDR7313486.1 glycerate kinase [Nocardioides luteus]GGR74527.1 glycerate kinase [Nocardioides luteus]GLJ70741.1 glycerate kinase [Nocardioides luteus]
MARVLVASDKFKGSLTAAQVAAAVSAGMRRADPDVIVDTVPVADGGDGTLAAAESAGFELVPVTVAGPTGEPVRTAYARRDEVAVVELADASGLARLPGAPDPLRASSLGTGQAVAAAIDAGCRRIVLGVGGSASTDGGAGLLCGLGATLFTAAGDPASPGGAGLEDVARIEVSELRRRLEGVTVTVACDVDNPLTGPSGAAAVYGPQKGADADQVRRLDAALGRWASLVASFTGTDLCDHPGAGAAGGVGFAALALLGAELRSGIELVLDLVDFAAGLDGAHLVVTGEGALDEQTLNGKAPTGVAAAAARAGVPVVAVCGVNHLDDDRLRAAGFEAAYALTDIEPDLRRCLSEGAALLEQIAERIAADHLTKEDA